MMRRHRLATLTLLLAAGLGGCDHPLTENPKTFLTTESFYKTPQDIESATLAAYQPLEGGNLYNWNLILTTELASDQTAMHPDEPNYPTYHPDFLGWTPTDASVSNPWNGFYDVITRANLVIEHAPDVEFADPVQRDELVAEARFLRGWSYLMLTKLYGDVPLVLDQEDSDNFEIARSPVEEVQAQAQQDLAAAEAALPESRPADEYGRVTKGAAQMALADLYQWRSSAQGSGEWQQASDWAKKVIDSGTYSLNDDYIATFLPGNKGNPEVIWSIVSSGRDGAPNSNVFCLYLPRALGFGTAGGCEVIGRPTMWHYESYAPGDYRREVTYRTEGCSTDPNIGCIELYPNLYKYRPSNNGVGGPSDVDVPVIYRYAEALLMYAEAENELGHPEIAAQYVNQVRARARQGTGSEARAEPADIPVLGHDAMRDAIFMERDWELAGEDKRWFDLVRRDGEEPGYFVSSIREHDPNGAKAYEQGLLTEAKKRWPIPQSQIQRDPALTQNEGY